MGIKLVEIEEGEHITLHVSSQNKTMTLDAVIKKQLRDNIALISMSYPDVKRLIFENVDIEIEYCQEEDVPIRWRKAKAVSFKGDYVIRAFTDGVRHNRRNSFRVSVAKSARMRMVGRGAQQVMIKDISLSGFSISDRKMDLGLLIGDRLSVSFEDLGHQLDLDGQVVRIEEREDMIIYGLQICNLCKDLSSYVSTKQRQNKKLK